MALTLTALMASSADKVHVESNDIMAYIEETWPSPGLPPFLPPAGSTEAAWTAETLATEDALHADMRTLTFGFLLPRGLAAKPAARLRDYAELGPADAGRAAEVGRVSQTP